MPYQGGRKEVRVNPADATAVQLTPAYELDDFPVGHGGRLMHQGVVGEQRLAATGVADEELLP